MIATETKTDIYQRVTDSIIEQLEKGTRPWMRPWSVGGTGGMPLRHDGTRYKGINTLILWIASEAKGYASSHWMTYRQAQSFDAHVRAGEKGSPVVYWDTFTKEDNNGDPKKIPFLKQYTVFNSDQIEGLPERFKTEPPATMNQGERIESADKFIQGTKAEIHHGGNRACYFPQTDTINMPEFDRFNDPESYYAVMLHELAHWTGAENRLKREFKGKRNVDSYAREELIAELASCFLGVDLEIMPIVREDHAAYIGHWLEAMKGDKRLIFQSAAQAQRAADYLHGLQGEI